MQNPKPNKITQPKDLPLPTADFDFSYHIKPAIEREEEAEVARRFKILLDRDILASRYDTGWNILDVLNEDFMYILCIIKLDNVIVGTAIMHEENRPLQGTTGIHVDAAHLDNIPGMLKAFQNDLEEIIRIERHDFLAFEFTRRGWSRMMEKYGQAGFEMSSRIGEKEYVRG